MVFAQSGAQKMISIHAPREGERRQHARGIVRKMKFQSTLPARGSDRQAFVCSLLQPYFNPRSPRGGATSICPQECTPTADFNPRSPRGGATFMPATSAEPTSKFQSTLPARGSDGAPEENYHATTKISIHAPREGERPRYAVGKSGGEDFNPRSPRGGATLG